jgi:hypothetical protein
MAAFFLIMAVLLLSIKGDRRASRSDNLGLVMLVDQISIRAAHVCWYPWQEMSAAAQAAEPRLDSTTMKVVLNNDKPIFNLVQAKVLFFLSRKKG